MSWIQENKVPAAILGLTGAGVVGLGFVLFNAWTAASEAQTQFDSVNVGLANLKSAPLAPTPENLAQKQALMQEYGKAVESLSTVLYKLQPEDKPTTNTEFQAKLKAKTADIKKEGAGRLPGEFNLGFDQYTNELPKSDQVAAELSTYLDSVDQIVRLLLKSGVVSLISLERSQLPSEKGEPDKVQTPAKAKAKGPQTRAAAPQPASITERRKVQIMVRADQPALQTLLSALTSPSEMPFFTVARLVRIENEVQVGPPRTAGLLPINDPTIVVEDPSAPPSPPKPVPVGGQPAPIDSQVVLGRELLRAYIEIDLVKFLNPQTAATPSR
jgi:hypothetical protein